MFNIIQKVIQRVSAKPSFPNIVNDVRTDGLSYLDETALNELLEQVTQLERTKKPGLLIEAGCALGGSALVIASAKTKSRPFYIYDVFGMIPPPSEYDGKDVHERYSIIVNGQSQGINSNKYYGYEKNLLEKVTDNFYRYGLSIKKNKIHLVKGLFQDTLHINEPVALAHLDGDWYESVITCLQRIEPYLIPSGVFVIDDYYAWSGCRRAVDEYFSDKQDQYTFIHKSRLHIIRNL